MENNINGTFRYMYCSVHMYFMHPHIIIVPELCTIISNDTLIHVHHNSPRYCGGLVLTGGIGGGEKASTARSGRRRYTSPVGGVGTPIVCGWGMGPLGGIDGIEKLGGGGRVLGGGRSGRGGVIGGPDGGGGGREVGGGRSGSGGVVDEPDGGGKEGGGAETGGGGNGVDCFCTVCDDSSGEGTCDLNPGFGFDGILGLGGIGGGMFSRGGTNGTGDSGGVGTRCLAPRSMVLARSRTLGVEGGDSCAIGSIGAGFKTMGGGTSLGFRGAGFGGGFLNDGPRLISLGVMGCGLAAGGGGRFSSSFPVAKFTCRSLCFNQSGLSLVSEFLGVLGRNPSGWGTLRGLATGGGFTGFIPGFGEGGGFEARGGLRLGSGDGGLFTSMSCRSCREKLLTFLRNSGVSSSTIGGSIST